MKLACPDTHHLEVCECSKKASATSGASGGGFEDGGLSCASAAKAIAITASITQQANSRLSIRDRNPAFHFRTDGCDSFTWLRYNNVTSQRLRANMNCSVELDLATE